MEFRDDEDDAAGGRFRVADSFAAAALAGTGTFAVLDARRAAGPDAATLDRVLSGRRVPSARRAIRPRVRLARRARPRARDRTAGPRRPRLDDAIAISTRDATRTGVVFVDIDGFEAVYIGRLGGDEFAVVVPDVADRAEVEAIALLPDDARSREDLLASADMAMYRAKDVGARARAGRRRRPLPALLRADSRRGDGPDHGCRGARRVHPLHGLLAPERGWSIASDPAGRRDLDRWVLREAATQARAWKRAGTPIRIDVDLATFVERCATNGMTFALEGFDGGLDTLSTLANLPIEAMKLDRPFIEGSTHDRTLRAVARGTIIVARSLGWSVIAKGVETDSQQEAVVTLGCDGIQGFFVAHPVTAAEFGVWPRDRRNPVR